MKRLPAIGFHFFLVAAAIFAPQGAFGQQQAQPNQWGNVPDPGPGHAVRAAEVAISTAPRQGVNLDIAGIVEKIRGMESANSLNCVYDNCGNITRQLCTKEVRRVFGTMERAQADAVREQSDAVRVCEEQVVEQLEAVHQAAAAIRRAAEERAAEKAAKIAALRKRIEIFVAKPIPAVVTPAEFEAHNTELANLKREWKLLTGQDLSAGSVTVEVRP